MGDGLPQAPSAPALHVDFQATSALGPPSQCVGDAPLPRWVGHWEVELLGSSESSGLGGAGEQSPSSLLLTRKGTVWKQFGSVVKDTVRHL